MLPGVNVSHKTVVKTVSTKYSINGRTYTSLDEMPPDVRRHFEHGTRETFSVGGWLSLQKALGSMRPGADPATRAPGFRVALVLALAIAFVLLLAFVLAARAG
jgi:hypothetical protein